MTDPDFLTLNLQSALSRLFDKYSSGLAGVLGVNQTTLYRWLNDDRKPNSAGRLKIATSLGIQVADLELHPDEFKSLLEQTGAEETAHSNLNISSNLMRKWSQSVRDRFDRIKGTYLLRYRLIETDSPYGLNKKQTDVVFQESYNQALLHIEQFLGDRIGFRLTEIVRTKKREIPLQYRGAFYALQDYYYFLAEDEVSNTLLTMIISRDQLEVWKEKAGEKQKKLMPGFIMIGGKFEDTPCKAGPAQIIFSDERIIEYESYGLFKPESLGERPLE